MESVDETVRIFFPGEWHRVGRGRVLQFYALDEEVATILATELPLEYSPYSLTGTIAEKHDKEYLWTPFSFEIHRFLEARSAGIFDFFVRSHVLTPEIPSEFGAQTNAILSLSGLPNLQQRSPAESSLGFVDKVAHVHGPVLVAHDEYGEVFDALKRAIRRLLRYTTITHGVRGKVIESRSILMSEEFKKLCDRGKIVPSAAPGRPLERAKKSR